MKPICLHMKAFGSYLHDTTLDFTALGEQPLFLITGATGGGKTTILDAMCFALYCRATGGRRSWAGMRSLGAPQEDETLVEFIFSYQNVQYKWFRSRQDYFSKRADTVKTKEVHECYRMGTGGDWELLYAGSEARVREQAEQLLGLSCEQFSQVVVLPQGDFLKLLLATSKEKAALLQTLFATEKWEHLTRRVRDHAAALCKQAEQNDAARTAILTREGTADLSALNEKCTALEAEQKQQQKALEAAKVQLTQCDKAYEIAAETATAYDRVQKCTAALNTATIRAKAAAEQAQQAQQALPLAQDLRKQAAALHEQAAARQSALDAARQLDTLQKEIVRSQAQVEACRTRLTHAEQTQQEAQARWEKGNTFCNELSIQVERLPALAAAVDAEVRADAAAAVAADLQPGCPCPVCGAVQHPHPAAPSAKLAALRQQQLEAAKTAEKLTRARAKVKSLEQQREAARREAQQTRTALAELESKLAADQASRKTIATQMQGSATLQELEQTVKQLRAKAQQLEQQEAQLRKSAADTQSCAAAATEALKKAQADCKEATELYQKALANFRAQPQAPQDTARPDEQAARTARETARRTAEELAAQTGRAAESLRSARQSQTHLVTLETDGQDLRKQYETASRLADLLSGRTKRRVPIQQFVLGIMLDDILASANSFFSDLSAGRYRLLRRTTPTGGNALSGLDLAVLDAASGGERDVATLSGGELFLASLSLAFGLSDVVQSSSGAVRLDALFIDEGFGSLDQETLDTAMGALLRLQKAGRTVGIISHVSELQAVIQKQIRVSRLPDGSSTAQVLA